MQGSNSSVRETRTLSPLSLESAAHNGGEPHRNRSSRVSWNPFQRITELKAEITRLNEEKNELLKQVTWSRMELKQYQRDQAFFGIDEPLMAGTGFIRDVVPPFAGARLRATVSSPSMAGYLFVADACHSVFTRLLKANSTDLDIGCGCGTHARNLLYHPSVKKFIGFDVYRDSIEWSQQSIVPLSSGRFEFHFLDVHNDAYNPCGKILAKEVDFPATDGSVHFAYAISLFTHLFEEDSLRYLSEVRRVLAQGGLFLPTILADTEAGPEYSGDEIRIEVKPEYFISMAQRAGLRLLERLGSLCGQEAFLFTV
jgi:SAM-dependent methyltransferase